MTKRILSCILIITAVIFFTGMNCSTAVEEETVKKVIIDAYINGFFLKGDAEAIARGFHPKCEMVTFRYIDINKQPISYWIDHYKKYPGPSYKNAAYKFLWLNVTERIANAGVEVQVTKEETFTAHFSLFKLEEGWKIVGKTVYRHGYQVPKDRKVAAVDPAVYDAYTGRYKNKEGLELIVTRTDNRLFIQGPMQPKVELFPQSETTYFSKIIDFTLTFEKNNKGVARQLRIRFGAAKDGKIHETVARRMIPKVAVFSGKIKDFRISAVVVGPFDSKDSALQKYGNRLNQDLELVPSATKGLVKGWFLVKAEPVVSTKDLETVGRVTSPHGTPAIDFSLKPAAAEKLKAYTTANQGKQVAIMLDNQVMSAPRIGGVISKRGMIEGNFTVEEVAEIVIQLKIAINKN